MRPLALTAVALALLVPACAGEEEAATSPTGAGANTVAACWEEAATTASRASASARGVLPGEITRARREYRTLRAAAARGDAQAFARARVRFFRALSRIEVEREEFETRKREASASLDACSEADPNGETVDVCWRSVASTYDESLREADRAFGPLLGTLFFTVRRLVDALEGGDAEAARRAEGSFLSAALRVQQAADRYAASHERARDLHRDCAGAA